MGGGGGETQPQWLGEIGPVICFHRAVQIILAFSV